LTETKKVDRRVQEGGRVLGVNVDNAAAVMCMGVSAREMDCMAIMPDSLVSGLGEVGDVDESGDVRGKLS
jgi:hypothetical protein